MNLSVKMFLQSAVMVLLLFISTYILFGFYYEEHEAIFDAFYSGKLSPGTPFYSWYYMGNIGLSYLYVQLYKLNSNIEWMSWILYSYMALSFSLILFLIHYLLKNKLPYQFILLVQLIVYVLIMADSVVHFNFTRVSYFLCTAALLVLIFRFKNATDIKSKPYIFISLNLLFILGTFTRLETAMAVTALLFFLGTYYQRNILHTVRLFLFPVFTVALVLGGIIFDIHHTNSFYKQVEPDVETQITVRGNYVPISQMKTEKDSLRYMAATEMIWGDPNVVTVSFLRSLLIHDSIFFLDARQWDRVKNTLIELADKYWHLITVNILIAFLYFFYLLRKERFKALLLWLIFVLSFCFLVAIQTYFVKINDRSFAPYLSILLLSNLILLLLVIDNVNVFGKWLFGFISAFALFFHCQYLLSNTQILKQERENYDTNIKLLYEKVGNSIIALNSSSFRFFMVHNKPFHPFSFPPFYKIYINEAQVLSTVHTYHEYLEKECACDVSDLSNFYRFLEKSSTKVYFLSMDDRMTLTRKYLKGIHNYDLEIQEVKVPGFKKMYDHEMAYIVEVKLYTFSKNRSFQP